MQVYSACVLRAPLTPEQCFRFAADNMLDVISLVFPEFCSLPIMGKSSNGSLSPAMLVIEALA